MKGKLVSAIIIQLFWVNIYSQINDSIYIFDYWESDPKKLLSNKTGYSEDYLRIIVNDKDTINLDAREYKKNIAFQHEFTFSNIDGQQYMRLNKSFNRRIKLAGLRIVKPKNEYIKIQVTTIHETDKDFKNKHYFDTALEYTAIENSNLALWNLYLFKGVTADTKNYFYPRYTLHSRNWPTPQQWAKYRKRRKVLKQIENAIVYRYNTVTRQIVKL